GPARQGSREARAGGSGEGPRAPPAAATAAVAAAAAVARAAAGTAAGPLRVGVPRGGRWEEDADRQDVRRAAGHAREPDRGPTAGERAAPELTPPTPLRLGRPKTLGAT